MASRARTQERGQQQGPDRRQKAEPVVDRTVSIRFGQGEVKGVSHKGELKFSISDFVDVVLEDVAVRAQTHLESEALNATRRSGTLSRILKQVREMKSAGTVTIQGETYANRGVLRDLLKSFLGVISHSNRVGLQTEDIFTPVGKGSQRLLFTEYGDRQETSRTLLQQFDKAFRDMSEAVNDSLKDARQSERILR